MKPTKWKFVTDVTDNMEYAVGISYKGQTVIYLNPGNRLNRTYGDKFIAMLNAKKCVIKLEDE